MAVMFGLAAGVAYGASDFIAGLMSRRINFMVVALIATTAAVTVVSIALAVTTRVGPSTGALLWGAASGIGSGLATLALYRGLGRGQMGVVAPVSAVCAATIPVFVGVLACLPAWPSHCCSWLCRGRVTPAGCGRWSPTS